MEYLKNYYENYNEDGRLATRHGMVEFVTTMHFITKYLCPGMRILEIGAATGRYSHALARMGYQVDAVELLEHNIKIFNENTQAGEAVSVFQGNAKDLSMLTGETYDITLLLGPMYHLFSRAEQKEALSEALRVTKKGGIVFAAYCMGDAAILSYGFVRGQIGNIIEKCMIDPNTFETFSKPWDIFELYRKEDVDRLMAHFPVTRLHYAAADGYANHMRQALSEMDEDTYQLYIKYHLATCEREDLLGYSHHTIDIFRKD